MQKRNWKKILAFVLSFSMLITALSTIVWQSSANELSDVVGVSKIVQKEPAQNAFVDSYLCEDGSLISSVFTRPVNYWDNGRWKNVDSRLVLSNRVLSDSGNATYMPRASALEVSFPQVLSDGEISIGNNGYTLRFSVSAENQGVSMHRAANLVDTGNLTSSLLTRESDPPESKGNKTRAEEIQEYNAEIMELENLSAGIAFEKVFPDADLEYVILSDGIEKYIVVYSQQAEYIYRFNMDLDGLVPVPQEDGSILLVEPNDPLSVVFILPAPYMYDANGAYSTDVKMTLENGVLTITADSAWLNSEERVLPAVIDPTINTHKDNWTIIHDSYASSRYPNASLGSLMINSFRLYTGNNSGDYDRAYVRFDLADLLLENIKILYGQFELRKESSNNLTLEVRDLNHPSTTEWKAPRELTWNNQPLPATVNSAQSLELIDSKNTDPGSTYYRFDVTSALESWYDGGNYNKDKNKGLVITVPNENVGGQAALCSSRAILSGNRPVLWFVYEKLALKVTPSSWSASAQGGNSSAISIESNTDWTITTNQNWLHVSKTSGSGDSNFTITADTTDSIKDRTGTVTVETVDGPIAEKIKVTQAGTELTVDSTLWNPGTAMADTTINVTSNITWNVSVDPLCQSWISVNNITNSSFEIIADENTNAAGRDGTVKVKTGNGVITETIYVTQAGTVLGVNPSRWTPGIQADSTDIGVKSTETWSVSVDQLCQDWLFVTKTSGSGNDDFTINVAANASDIPRSGTVTVETLNSGAISTIDVTQEGMTLGLGLSSWSASAQGGDSPVITIASNTGWTITPNQSWLSATETSGSGNSTFTISAEPNTGVTERTGTVTVQTGANIEVIQVMQVDELSGFFNNFNPDGSLSLKASTEYSHPLGTFAMELSFAAYFPLPIGFTGGLQTALASFTKGTKPIEQMLEDYEFQGVVPKNYGHTWLELITDNWLFRRVGFTIAHRDVVVDSSGTTRPLVVVPIRGTAADLEWLGNVLTATTLTDQLAGFPVAFEEVRDDLDTYLDASRVGGTLRSKNPMILITGHSRGAAIANMLAAHLNNSGSISPDDIYAYTFATPNVDRHLYDARTHTNIFNILNNNDVVTFVPRSILGDNIWGRYGLEFPFSMPPSSDWICCIIGNMEQHPFGVFGHMMQVYLEWMTTGLPNELSKPPEDITCADMRDASTGKQVPKGMLPILLSAKCPVGVTVYDSEGYEMAHESTGGAGSQGQGGMGVQSVSSQSSNVFDSDVFSWVTEDDAKVFFILPGSDASEAIVVANDSGTMNLSIATVDASSENQPHEVKTFEDVDLFTGRKFKTDLTADISDVCLWILDEYDNIIGKVAEDGTEIIYIIPGDFEEPLMNYLLAKTAVPLDQMETLVGAILALDILSLDALRDIYEKEGYTETETEDLIEALLTNYSTDDLYMCVAPLLNGEDFNQWLEPNDDLWPWVWYLEALIDELTDCIMDTLDLDEYNPGDIEMTKFAVQQVLMGYSYLIRAEQSELRKIALRVFRDRNEEVGLLYQALDTLLAGDAFAETMVDPLDEAYDGLCAKAFEFSELDENEAMGIFDALLPAVLPLEMPSLDNLLQLCNGWGYTQTKTEETVELIAALLATEPFVAAVFLSNDELGGFCASLYDNGPVPSSGGCSDTSHAANALTLASATYYPIASAIRSRAANVLELDPQDENDAYLLNLISEGFLYCYFAEYLEQVNIWLVAQGDAPIDFGNYTSQVSQFISQMNDMLLELGL